MSIFQGHQSLAETDLEIFQCIRKEEEYEKDTLRLIASENYASRAVIEATGSVFTNKYSEGYSKKRYYEGQDQVDTVEDLACSRLANVFGAEHVNVQPYSGSPANLAVYLAFAKPGETIMGLALPSGGHLTHGWNVSISGKFWKSVLYNVHPETHLIDMDQVRHLALEHKPKLLWCGASAYPRMIDFAAFRSIADEIGAILVADIAHIAGLVAGGVHPSPVGIADVVTMTTHKSFRGPRGAAILCKKEHASSIDKAIFPGLQGGPHNHTTAAIAVAAKEALDPSFKIYAKQVVDNAKRLAEKLIEKGFKLTTGGTDNHLMLLDATSRGLPGKVFAQSLARAGIVANSNAIPFDPRKPFDPSGVRIGTSAVTSRGMGLLEIDKTAEWFHQVADHSNDETMLARIANEVKEMCKAFPAPGIF